MNQSQEQTQTCSNCNFSEKALQTSFNDVPDPEQVKCSKDNHYHNAIDDACYEWKAKENQL